MDNRKRIKHLKYLTLSAVFAAMICVVTAFVHIPTHQGYIHVGDGIIFIAAAVLPAPYAMGAAAIGAGMSDYLSGYAMWVLPTMIIKSLMVLFFDSGSGKILCKRNIFALIPAGLICVGGYYLFGVLLSILSGSAAQAALMAALADVPSNMIQITASSGLFFVLGAGLDKSGVRLTGKRL